MDNLSATDTNSSNLGEPRQNETKEHTDHDESRAVMQRETIKEPGDVLRQPDSTPETSQPESAMPGQKSAPNELTTDEGASSLGAHVHLNGEVAEDGQNVRAKSSAQVAALSTYDDVVLYSPWHEQDEQPSAVITHEMKGSAIEARNVLSPNGTLADVMHKSPVRGDKLEGGPEYDDADNRPSPRTQGLVGQRKKAGEEGGDDDDRKRRLVHRLMGSVLAACLLVFTAYLSMVPLLSQYLFRRFAVEHFNLTNVSMKKTPCAQNGNDSVQHAISWLQSETSQQLFHFSIVHSVPAVFVALFVGSYTDYLGRKFLVLVPMIGGFLKSLVTVLVMYLKLDVEILYVAHALDGVLGSIHVMTLGLFAAIADVTISSRQRVLLFAVLEISVALAGAVSQIGTGYLIDATGFVVPSFIITCLAFVACLCILLFMPETLRNKPQQLVLNPLVHLRKVFGFYFWDGSLTKRALFCGGLIILFIVVMINTGRLPVETLFEMNSPFCWGSIQIGFFTGFRLLLQNLAGVATLKVMSKHVRIELIGMVGLLSGMSGFIIQSVADVDAMMYISGLVGVLITVAGPIARTLMSRMAPAERQGALFASVSAMETLCGLAASTVFNNVYSASLNHFHGAVFVLMAALLLVDFGLLVLFTVVSHKFPHFREVQITVEKPDTGASPSPARPARRSSDETTPLLTSSRGTKRHPEATL